MTPRKPELVPMMMGTCPPTGPTDQSWMRVMMPAASMAFCSSVTYSAGSSALMPQMPQMIISGVRLPTNMASTCCSPRGMACRRGMAPLNV